MTDQQFPTPPPTSTPQVPAANPRWWRNRKIRLAIAITGVAMIILARYSLAEKRGEQDATAEARQDIASYLVGDCVTLGTAGDDVQRTDCSTDPSFTVGAALDTDRPCASINYIEYNWSVDNTTIGRLCLAENLTAGQCYQPNSTGRTLEQIDCTTADDKAYKVIERLDADNPALCPANTTAYNYPTPARTYCLSSPSRDTPPR
jgi:hypothetical protein